MFLPIPHGLGLMDKLIIFKLRYTSGHVYQGEERRLFLAHDGLLVLARHVVPLGAVLKRLWKRI